MLRWFDAFAVDDVYAPRAQSCARPRARLFPAQWPRAMWDRVAGEASAPGMSKRTQPGAAPATGGGDARIASELVRWAREPPGDEDTMLWGPWQDWTFATLFEEQPGYVHWCLTTVDVDPCTRQQARFWEYVAHRLHMQEARCGTGAAGGQAQEGDPTAPGEVRPPACAGMEDGVFPRMLADAVAEEERAARRCRTRAAREGQAAEAVREAARERRRPPPGAPGAVEAGQCAVS